MPSPKNPVTIVVPGPGRLPASTISASAFIIPGGGGGGAGAMAALMAHITDPVDAHMAGAIGIPPVYPPTGEPLLSSNVPPGVIDGESVLDFIAQFKDLLPPRPAYLGFAGTPNSGVPDWGTLDTIAGGGTAANGGYDDGAGNSIYTHYVVPNATGNFILTGTLYPADRGVIALYRNTAAPFNNFANPFTGASLVGALYLGTTNPVPPTPPPVGVPVAGFDETLRTTGQANYVSTGAGDDIFDLTYRLPYLTSYAPGVPYAPYGQNFYSFQLATFSVTQVVAAGNAHDWFIVHWRSTFATSLNAIDPAVAVLSLADLTAANCYSAVPTVAADFDDPANDAYAINRHHVYRDASSGTTPALVAWPTATFTANTHKLSGVDFYDATGAVTLNYALQVADLFQDSFTLGSSAPIPASYQGTDPLILRLVDFGTADVPYRYDQIADSTATLFSLVNPPAPADDGYLSDPALALVPSSYTVNSFATPYSTLAVAASNVWANASLANPTKFLWNSWTAAGSTTTQENFVEESYRYATLHVPVATDRIVPTGVGVPYDSTALLSADTNSLQVIGSRIVYPKIDFQAAAGYRPVGQPDYSVLPGTDGVGNLRRHMRAFDTGVARNTGKLRIRGLAAADFQVDAPYDGSETTGHLTGGAIIQVKVPGVTGWLDIGRSLGDPGVATLDYYGCATSVLVSGSDITVSFQTTAFTANNGFGEFPLFVRVTFINGAAGLALSLDELEWLAP